MALDIPTDRPLRSPRQLLQLVTAIRDAGDHDENDWIEWKSTYDLTTKEVRATLARHIIGMANRMPDKAAAICHGYGYIAIGVEPGQVEGVTTIDLADLDSGLQPYLGHQGPEWSANHVTLDGRTILVLTVEPPKLGDLIHTLNKDFSKYVAGMIFVRRSGRTVQANPGEVAALTRRATLKTSSPQHMTVTAATEPVEVPLYDYVSHVDHLCTRKKIELLDRRRMTKRPGSLGMSLDNRDTNDYRKEVAEYLEDYREHLVNQTRKLYTQAGNGELQLTVYNPDELSHQGVRIELHFPKHLTAILAEDYTEFDSAAPAPPEPLGTKISFYNSRISSQVISPTYRGPSELETRISMGSVIFNIASVRAEGHMELPSIHFIAETWTADEQTVSWAITALNSSGRARGEIQLSRGGLVTFGPPKTDPQVDS
ncbi:AlbA family DNA-binding domain-containing protein [Streptomyces althioticus]|uniref:AlbA family DNA-binding domain-containing protein n=1 Tax=Streptomyces althioticus TaxID=83380 RepID=UPI0036C8B9E4